MLRECVTDNHLVAVLYTCLGRSDMVAVLIKSRNLVAVLICSVGVVEELSVLSVACLRESVEATDLSTFIETEEVVA